MDIDFSIGSIPAKLTRGWFWGGMKIETPDESHWVQHPLHPLTHFSVGLTDKWTGTVVGQTVTVEKRRRLWLAGARPQNIKVFVGGALVAEKQGYQVGAYQFRNELPANRGSMISVPKPLPGTAYFWRQVQAQMITYWWVGLGGFLGAIARYAVAVALPPATAGRFPLATFAY